MNILTKISGVLLMLAGVFFALLAIRQMITVVLILGQGMNSFDLLAAFALQLFKALFPGLIASLFIYYGWRMVKF